MIYILKKIALVIAFVLVGAALLALAAKFFVETKNVSEIAPEQSMFARISNGEEIGYQEISNNATTTIVFVGGLSGWSQTWGRTMRELDRSLLDGGFSYNLLAVDLPPFGFSAANLENGFYRSVQADRLNAFLDSKKMSNVIFVAHSYGAGPVTEAVMTNDGSQNIEKLVIVDGVLNVNSAKADEASGIISKIMKNKALLEYPVLAVSHSKALVKNRMKSFVHITENIDANLVELYMKAFRTKGNSKRLAHWLSDYVTDPLDYKSTKAASYENLSVPLRIIWGDKDTLTPPALAHELADLVPGSKLYMLENVGHIPMIEDYQQFDEALRRAISE